MRALLCAVALFVAGPAFAQSSETVSVSANMSDPGQVARVHQVVIRAADNVCKKAGVTQTAELRDCVRQAVNDAIAANPSRELKAFHESLPAAQRYQING